MERIPLKSIKNRKEFNEYFDSVLKGSYEKLRYEQRLDYDQNLPKSYIIEYHNGKSQSDTTRDEIYKIFSEKTEESNLSFSITKDYTLAYLRTENAEFFIDTLNTRFLIFHTLNKSTQSDNFIFSKLTKYSHIFDIAWFTINFLEELGNSNIVEGWDVRFNPFLDSEYVKKPGYIRNRFSMSIDKDKAWDKYLDLKRNVEIKKYELFKDLPLETLRLRKFDMDDGNIARARIKSDGKITGRGTSFQHYLLLVTTIQKCYETMIKDIENKYSLKYITKDTGFTISGKPYIIKFSESLKNRRLDKVLEEMFSCTWPYRLLGTPKKIGEDYFRIRAIDLHIGEKLSFEITPYFIRIYLPDGSCGNSIVRIVRSLQHSIDANLTIEEGK